MGTSPGIETECCQQKILGKNLGEETSETQENDAVKKAPALGIQQICIKVFPKCEGDALVPFPRLVLSALLEEVVTCTLQQ